MRETVPRVTLNKIDSLANHNVTAHSSPTSHDDKDESDYEPLSPVIPKPDDPLLNRPVICTPTVNGTVVSYTIDMSISHTILCL